MKALIREIAAANTWANKRLADFILSIPEEKQLAEVPSSFSSLYKTLLHMWDAETAWWQRIKMAERLQLPSDNFNGNMPELVQGLLDQSTKWEQWLSTATNPQLEHVCQYQNSKREVVKMPVYQIAFHVFNHGTYHRGQLVNILRQLGIDKVPQTDFSVWTRKREIGSRSPAGAQRGGGN